METLGNVNCVNPQTLTLDYANGEYIKKITVKATASIAVRITLETSLD